MIMDGKSRFTRLDMLNFSFLCFCLGICLLGLSNLKTDTEDVLQWLPDSSAERQEYDRFEQQFGSDDFLIVTWDQCTVDDPRLADFARSVDIQDNQQLIQSVVNGSDIHERLSKDLGLSKVQVESRFRGLFYALDDPNQTLVIVELTKKGSATRRVALEMIDRAINSVAGLELDDVIFGGYPYLGINIDNQIRNSIVTLLLPSFLMATFVLWYCLRSLTLTTIVFSTAVAASACSVAIVPLFGVKFGGLMAIIPALVFVLVTSGSIHLIRYSLSAIGDLEQLISIGWKPCTISAVTTAIGMLSLVRSSFPAIRNFGFFCATGTGFALLFQLLVIPWLLSQFGERGQRKLAARSLNSRTWPLVGYWVERQRTLISFVGISLMIGAAFGLPALIARVDVDMLFDPDSKIITSLSRLESRMGPIDQSEFLITFDDVGEKGFGQRAGLVRQIQGAIQSLSTVQTTHSLQNYLPKAPGGSGLGASARRAVFRKKLTEKRDKLAEGRYLSIDGNVESWRISMRYPFTQESNVNQQKASVVQAVEKVVAKANNGNKGVSTPTLTYTGKNHLFHSAQTILLEDLFRNFLLAFVIITPVLIVVLRSLSLGLIAMVPNLFPIIILFGALGWLQFPVDLAIAMTACVALGIAVDDTTHFLMRFRDHGGNLSNVSLPIQRTLPECGAAMLHTTAIGAAGELAFALSDMLVIRNFAWAITAMLVIALVADMILLPAVLSLFAGKPFPSKAVSPNEALASSEALSPSGEAERAT